MKRRITTICLLVCAGAAGCTGLEPAAISAGASAAQSGATFFTQGKFSSIELAPFALVEDAVRHAIREMSLTLEEESAEDGRARIVVEDEEGQSIVVVIERRTETVTLIQADVGTFGENGLASLFMRQTALRLQELLAERKDAAEREP